MPDRAERAERADRMERAERAGVTGTTDDPAGDDTADCERASEPRGDEAADMTSGSARVLRANDGYVSLLAGSPVLSTSRTSGER